MNEKQFLEGLTLIIDSREQTPYSFSGRKVEVSNLQTGDYSVKGLENKIAIERKGNDLIQSICQNRERFERELSRSASLDYFAIVCECSFNDIARGNYVSHMKPASAIQTLLAFSVRYKLPIFFAENRSFAERIVESLLDKYARENYKIFSLLT